MFFKSYSQIRLFCDVFGQDSAKPKTREFLPWEQGFDFTKTMDSQVQFTICVI